MKVIAERTAILLHFLLFGQFTAFSGSFGPSQSTMFGSLGSVFSFETSFSSSAASTSLSYDFSSGVLLVDKGFDSPPPVPLAAVFEAADTNESEEDGRTGGVVTRPWDR